MLKKKMTYTDYNSQERTEDFYFNISKGELAALEIETPGGFSKYLQDIAMAKDGQALVQIMKQLIDMGIGQKSEDGRRFVKSEDIRLDFQQTEAYSDLFMMLATDEQEALTFITGMLPEGMSTADVMEAAKEAQETGKSPSDIVRERSEAQMQGHKKEEPAELQIVRPEEEDISEYLSESDSPNTANSPEHRADSVNPTAQELANMTSEEYMAFRNEQERNNKN